MPNVGLVAASEADIERDRLALPADPGRDLAAVTAALLDGVELLALADTGRLRGAVLLPTEPWQGAACPRTVQGLPYRSRTSRRPR
jgi:hypothetical protein